MLVSFSPSDTLELCTTTLFLFLFLFFALFFRFLLLSYRSSFFLSLWTQILARPMNLKLVADSLRETRPSLDDLCASLAVLAEFKPDCRRERKEVLWQYKDFWPFPNRKQILLLGTTGACVLDESGKICLVEGSGKTHVSSQLQKNGSLMKNSTIFLSRHPCSKCMIHLTLLQVKKVIIVDTRDVNLRGTSSYLSTPEPRFDVL